MSRLKNSWNGEEVTMKLAVTTERSCYWHNRFVHAIEDPGLVEYVEM